MKRPPGWMALPAALLLLGGAHPTDRPRPEGPAERASYSLGHQIGRDLLMQGAALDHEALRRGLTDGLNGESPELAPDEMRKILALLKRQAKASDRTREREESLKEKESGRAFMDRNRSRPGVTALESGLQFEILTPGTGPSPGPGDKVLLHYRGTTLDGKVIHDTRVRPGHPETLHVSGVVAGLTEALQLMKPGSRWRVFLPPELAYGRRGPLANHALVFDLELISIVPSEGTEE